MAADNLAIEAYKASANMIFVIYLLCLQELTQMYEMHG